MKLLSTSILVDYLRQYQWAVAYLDALLQEEAASIEGLSVETPY